MKRLQATARVRIVIEVDAGAWGDDCTVQQINEQAGRDAVLRIQSAMRNQALRIIGEPHVTAIMTSSNEVE